ncbi:DNA-binding protein [Acinetobacter sp.]|uniref:DNA-binding protein n=1 Tax=Acinetobacter sp. TaxID=472 RepID=UPI003D02756D
MARKATITQEQVNTAANDLVASGQMPTNRAVLEKLGSGSMATIVKLMQQWRSSQDRAKANVDEVLDAKVVQSIQNMLSIKIKEATAQKYSEIALLQNDLQNVITENEHQAILLEENDVQLSELQAQVQSQAGQIEQLETEATRLREQISQEIKLREAAQFTLAKAEVRIESLPAIMEELKEARAEAKRKGEEVAELRGTLVAMNVKTEKKI